MAQPITSQPIKNTINSIDLNNEEDPQQAGQTENKVKEQIKKDKGCCRSFFFCCSRKKSLHCQNVEPDIDFDPNYGNYDSYVNNDCKSTVNDNFKTNLYNGCIPILNDHWLQDYDARFHGTNQNSNMYTTIEPATATVAVAHNDCTIDNTKRLEYCTANYESHNNHSSNNDHYNHSSYSCDDNDYATSYDAGDSGGGDCGGCDD